MGRIVSENSSNDHGPGSAASSTHLADDTLDDNETSNESACDSLDVAQHQSSEILADTNDGIRKKISLKNSKRAKYNTGNSKAKFLVECRQCKESFETCDARMYHGASFHAKGTKKTFECHLCKKQSSGRQALQIHMKSMHTGHTLLHKCPYPMCSKSFTQKSHLNAHTNEIHTKKIMFECDECGKKFYRKGHLIDHLKSKHGMKFKCNLCKTALASKQSLKRHMNSMHNAQ